MNDTAQEQLEMNRQFLNNGDDAKAPRRQHWQHLRPAVNCRAVDENATLGHHFLEVAQAQR